MKMKLFAVLFGIMAAGPAFAAEQIINLSVPGMTCASCPFIVEAAIIDVDGVSEVSADIDQLSARVVFDDERATIDQIIAATTNAGYAASVIADNS